MKDKQQVARELINFLDVAIRQRPTMYLGTDDPEVVYAFVRGMAHTAWICGYQLTQLTYGGYHTILTRRGWISNQMLIPQMRDAGMDNLAMLNEIIDIEIEIIAERADFNLK